MESRSISEILCIEKQHETLTRCATAGKVTIVEVEELVDTGELDPDEIHTPGVYVQKVL